jgi:hypothetical protein
MLELAQCKLEQYSSVTEWMAVHSKIVNDLSVCGFPVDDQWRVHYIIGNLAKTAEWTHYAQTLELTGQAADTGTLIKHLLTFEAKLRRDRGLSPEDALFVTRRQKNGKNRGRSNENSSDKPEKDSKSNLKCYGCGIKGHKISECKHPEKWQAHQKSKGNLKDSANMAADSEPCQSSAKPDQLFVIYPVLRATPVVNSSDWIFDTGASNHVTGIRD